MTVDPMEIELRRLGALDALEVTYPPAPDTGPGLSIAELERWRTRSLMRSLLRRSKHRHRSLLARIGAAPFVTAGGVALVVIAFQRGLA